MRGDDQKRLTSSNRIGVSHGGEMDASRSIRIDGGEASGDRYDRTDRRIASGSRVKFRDLGSDGNIFTA